jgi:hypothetical protein
MAYVAVESDEVFSFSFCLLSSISHTHFSCSAWRRAMLKVSVHSLGTTAFLNVNGLPLQHSASLLLPATSVALLFRERAKEEVRPTYFLRINSIHLNVLSQATSLTLATHPSGTSTTINTISTSTPKLSVPSQSTLSRPRLNSLRFRYSFVVSTPSIPSRQHTRPLTSRPRPTSMGHSGRSQHSSSPSSSRPLSRTPSSPTFRRTQSSTTLRC